MTEEIIIAGFGGQGVLSMGQILCYGGVMQEKEVSWFPSYGPEMRGGTANCTAIISDDKISSPVLHTYDTAIVLNQPSMDKFEPTIKPGGLLIYESNGMTRKPVRKDINIWAIDAYDESIKMKNTKVFNMIVIGGFLKVRPILEIENVILGLKKVLPERYHHLVPLNEQAIRKGMEIINSEWKAN
jgi:2-oxoglutarate ferredoxin oxidoreductase subunit gamma